MPRKRAIDPVTGDYLEAPQIRTILRALEKYHTFGATIRQISADTRIPISSVRARLSLMARSGLARQAGTAPRVLGKRAAHLWKAT